MVCCPLQRDAALVALLLEAGATLKHPFLFELIRPRPGSLFTSKVGHRALPAGWWLELYDARACASCLFMLPVGAVLAMVPAIDEACPVLSDCWPASAHLRHAPASIPLPAGGQLEPALPPVLPARLQGRHG